MSRPIWNWRKLTAIVGLLGLAGLAAWTFVSFIHTAGRDAEMARTARASDVIRTEARKDERSASEIAAQVATRVSHHVDESRRAIDAVKEAIRASEADYRAVPVPNCPGVAATAAIDPSRVRAALNSLVDRANGAADDAGLSAGAGATGKAAPPGISSIGPVDQDR